MTRTASLLLLVLTGCIFGSSALDGDGDGAPASLDCDDNDANVFPRAAETCDGVDNDCDGAVDESIESAPVWYTDGDGDGFGTPAGSTRSCLQPAGTVTNDADCDDANPALHPSAVEACNEVDDDCDGAVDDDLPTIWYLDADGDGYGFEVQPGPSTCTAPDGYVARGGDCDDARADMHPMAVEVDCGFDATDYNCDGSVGYADTDGDGISACGGDCDDSDARRSPALPERCDAEDLDEDCDGSADDLDPDGTLDTVPWATDTDGDGFGGATRIDACDAAVGRLPVDGDVDCNDLDPLVSPAATEACDPLRTDEDCDGYADEADPDGAAGMGPRLRDADGDGRGDPDEPVVGCASDPATSATAGDCDDDDPMVYSGAAEIAGDGIDQDCDGEESCFVDDDADGWGDAAVSSVDLACASLGVSSRSGDCDDTTSAVRPRAAEVVANGVDSDCDGFEICYLDADLDGYGDASASLVSSADVTCTSPGLSVLATDCDDANPSVHPGAAEIVADGIDADCDARELCWTDSDRDGYGSSRTTSTLSLTCTGSGVAARTGDCYDIGSGSTPARVYPGAARLESSSLCMEDKDGDGWGDNTPTSSSITAGTDCHDSMPTIYPGAAYAEHPTACMMDADGDGWGDETPSYAVATRGNDCDDADATVNPSALEVCDGVDNNCDGRDDPGSCVAL